jgi:hypothetical protein
MIRILPAVSDVRRNMFDHIVLEQEQEDLLKSMVEAVRNTPRDRRSGFILVDGGMVHSGLPGGFYDAHLGDLEILTRYTLLSKTLNSRRAPVYDIHPFGYRYYEYLQKRAGEPVDQVEEEVRRYFDAHTFQARHPFAYREWCKAADKLWSSDSERNFTSIGHDCREAMKEFAEDLINEFELNDIPVDKQKTVDRIRAVLRQRKRMLDATEQPFLGALLPYWGTVWDLVQRQEHGAQQEGEPLIWEDARRVVFQTLIVMYEIDRALHR